MLQVTPRLEAGGVEEATVDLAVGLARLGHRSWVASAGGGMERRLADGGARLARLPLHARDPARILANGVRLGRLARAERMAVLHARSRAPAFSGRIAARLARRPLVTTYHGIYPARSSAKRWYNRVMTRGDLVIANSAFTRDHILSEHPVDPDKIVLVPEGVDTGRFDPATVTAERVARQRAQWGLAPGEKRLVLLLAARPAAWKGHALLIAALAGAVSRGKVLAVLTGAEEDPPFAADLARRAANAGLGQSVHLAPRAVDMPLALAAADIVVAPSLSPESFGRSVVEAGAMGRPVLASAIGAHTETIEREATGWLAPPADRAAWSAAIDQAVATGAGRRVAMGEAARRRAVERYSLEAMVTGTLAVYRRAITEHRRVAGASAGR